MNVQRLIEKYKKLEGVWDAEGAELARQIFLQDLEQLDGPEPVKIPQFVADWYEKKKHDLNHYIWDYIYNWNHQEESEFKRWMNCSITTFQTLVNMHQFGYEVEKEKRYVVKIKGNIKENMLVYGEVLERYFFTKSLSLDNAIYSHTRKELDDADFGWVFDCPGIEIEEVNE